MAREDEGEEELVARDAQTVEDIAVGGLHAFVCDRLQCSGHARKAFYGGGSFAEDLALDGKSFARGRVCEAQRDAARLGAVVDDLLGAYAPQGRSRNAEGDGLDEGGFPGAVAALVVVVGVAAEYEGRGALCGRILQFVEGAYILC